MPAKIRLSRHGRKGHAFYHIVIADVRAPRDGRYIERIGTYNPNTNPATIDLNFEKALKWLQNGAQPTDTARAILSYKGVLLKDHLLRGVKKGALTEEQAEAKFQTWMKEKEGKIQDKIDKLSNLVETDKKQRHEAEVKINEERAAAIAKKKSQLAAELAKADAKQETQQVIQEETQQVIQEETQQVTQEETQQVTQEETQQEVSNETQTDTVETSDEVKDTE